MKESASNAALGGVLTALALVLGYVEHLIPFNFGIYGLKLGLSNLVTVTALFLLGGAWAVTVNLVRILLSSLLFGSAVSLAYSLAGGMLSVAVMILVKQLNRSNKLSAAGISILGGVTHNAGQLAVAIVLVDNLKIAFYLPVLICIGALTGFLIGATALLLLNNKGLQRSVEAIKGGKRNDE